MITKKQVPRSALQLSAELEFGDNGSEAKTMPVKMLARTGDAISHPYWGNIVHDMAGMKHKSRIPIDYDHKEVMGFANKFDVLSGDLWLSGIIQTVNPIDDANEVMCRGKAGQPYEASINFDDDVTMEKVSAFQSVTVNGRTIVGPAVIFRNWTLRGVAITPYGKDKNTTTEFKEVENEMITINYIEEDSMQNKELSAVDTVVTAVETVVQATETAIVDTAEKAVEIVETVVTDVVSGAEKVAEKVIEEVEAVPDSPTAVETKPVETVAESAPVVETGGEVKVVEAVEQNPTAVETPEPQAKLSEPVVQALTLAEYDEKTQMVANLQKENTELKARLDALCSGEQSISFSAESITAEASDIDNKKLSEYKNRASEAIVRIAAGLKFSK